MKLALFGQWRDISGLIYTFPDKLSSDNSELPDWVKSLFDPRHVRGIFKGDYCYVLWYNHNGYYYSCIKTNTDSRNGCVMLTIYAGNMVPLDGRRMVEKMRMLLDYCLAKNNYTEIAFADVLIRAKEIENLLTQRSLPEAVSMTPNKEMAFRLYRNEDELGFIMENPNQIAYAAYKRVLVVEESGFAGEATQPQSITQITDTIRKTYDVRSDSREVVANKESVLEGEMLRITFRKPGYADSYVEIVAGSPSPYYTINGNVINLRSASSLGINFKKEIILVVTDAETNAPIKGWKCDHKGALRNENIKKNADGSVGFQVDPSRSYKFVVFAEGYEEKTIDLPAGDCGIKQVRLRSLDDSVAVRLQYGKERLTDKVRLKSNNKLFIPLKKLDQEREVLEVQRPFFSKRNLVPIIVLFLVSLLVGGVLGRFVLKGKQPKPKEHTVTVDSTEYSNQMNQLNELDRAKEKFQQATDEIAEYKELLTLYGKVLALIKEKADINHGEVVAVLGKPDYGALLSGNVTEQNTFDSLLKDLGGINKKAKKNEDSIVPASNDKKKKNDDATLIDLLKQNIWDLNAIENTGSKGALLVKKIKKNDIDTMIGNHGYNGDNAVFKMATEFNPTWKIIIDKVRVYNHNKRLKFGSEVNTYLENNNDKLNLNYFI